MLIQNKEARVHHLGNTRLLPGVNQVSDKAWEEALKLNTVRILVAQKKLVAVSGSEKAQGNSLAGYDPVEASELISETFDERLLNTWLAGETRPDIRMHIADQLKSMADPNEKRTTEQGIAKQLSATDQERHDRNPRMDAPYQTPPHTGPNPPHASEAHGVHPAGESRPPPAQHSPDHAAPHPTGKGKK